MCAAELCLGVTTLIFTFSFACGALSTAAEQGTCNLLPALPPRCMQALTACAGYDAGPEARHRLIYRDGDRTTFCSSAAGYRFATSNVDSLFIRQAATFDKLPQLVRFLSAPPDRWDSGNEKNQRRLMFEAYAHAALAGGGRFQYRYLDSPCGAAAQPLELQLVKVKETFFSAGSQYSRKCTRSGKVCTDVTSFSNAASQLQLSGVQSAYLQPSGQGHPLVDGCIYPDNLLHISATGNVDTVDEQELEAHLACLPDRPQYFLTYVVPPYVYNTVRVPELSRFARVQRTRVRVVNVIGAGSSTRLR